LRLYETTLVIDSLLKSDDIERIVRNLKEFISNNGGEVVRVEEWGKRRLAYEIEKKQYGYYVYVRFQAPPNLPKLLEREYRLNDNILRYLTVLVDPKLLLKEERQRTIQQQAARGRPSQRPAAEAAEATAPAETAGGQASEEKPVEAEPEAAEATTSEEATADAEATSGAETQEEPTEPTEDQEVIKT